MKKTLTVLMVLFLAMGFIFAGGSSESGDAGSSSAAEVTEDDLYGITLTMYHAQNQENAEALNKVIDLFNRTNEYGITVQGSYQGDYTATHKKTLGTLSSHTPPNISQAYNNNIMLYIPSQQLLDLTPYFSDEYGITPEDWATIDPAYLEENSSFPDGKLYAVSLGKSHEILFYNKTFMDQHGIAVPTTLDELTAAAEACTAITHKPSFAIDSAENWGIYGPQNFGAEYADVDGNVYIFDENNIDKTRAFYEWWENGIDKGIFRLPGDDQHCSGPFGAGDIIMFIGSTSGVNYIKTNGFEAAVARIPVGPDPHVIQQGGNYCGFKSGDPATDLATSIFLEFLYTPEASALYAANTGYLPSNKAAFDLPELDAVVHQDSLNGQAKAVCKSYPQEWKAYDPVFEDSFAVRKALSYPLEGIAVTNASIDDLFKETQKKLAEILDY